MFTLEDEFYDELLDKEYTRQEARLNVVKLVRDVSKDEQKRKRTERQNRIRERKNRKERQRFLGED